MLLLELLGVVVVVCWHYGGGKTVLEVCGVVEMVIERRCGKAECVAVDDIVIGECQDKENRKVRVEMFHPIDSLTYLGPSTGLCVADWLVDFVARAMWLEISFLVSLHMSHARVAKRAERRMHEVKSVCPKSSNYPQRVETYAPVDPTACLL